MTIQGAIAELQNLINADDVPFYYKGGIKKVIETIQMELPIKPDRPKTTETMMVNGEPTEIDPLSYEVGYSHGQSERPKGECRTCERCSDHCCETDENLTRCPIEEHYSLPKDGYCHLYDPIWRGDKE